MITAVIPSKTISNLVPCLQAVRKHEPDARVIVVDDGIDWQGPLHKTCDWLTVIPGVQKFIFARNVNLGIEKAFSLPITYDTTRYSDPDFPTVLNDPNPSGIVILNDDAILESPGGFSLLAREAEAHPEFGIIGVTTNLTGQPLQFRRQRMPGIPLQWPVVGLREVPHIAFVGVYIPRRTLETVGLLDERYCIDYGVDDRDYCEAVARAGLKVGVHDGCYVDHGSLVSSFRGDPKTPKSFAKNLALFEAKCRHCDRTGERFTASAGMAVAV